jgi:hypothetical protein
LLINHFKLNAAVNFHCSLVIRRMPQSLFGEQRHQNSGREEFQSLYRLISNSSLTTNLEMSSGIRFFFIFIFSFVNLMNYSNILWFSFYVKALS